MNLLIDEAERFLENEFFVYWVDGGPPDLFTLAGLRPMPAVFSSRYLELAHAIRRVIVAPQWLAPFRKELAERICLRIVAEHSLRSNCDFAVQAFLKSIIGQTLIIPFGLISQLKSEAMDEAYMAMWFFGLAHELGHSGSIELLNEDNVFSEIAIAHAANLMADRLGLLEVPEHARSQGEKPHDWLDIALIREECVADWAAMHILYHSTKRIMRMHKVEFRLENYLNEMCILINIVATIERCKSSAAIRGGRAQQDAAAITQFLQMHVRQLTMTLALSRDVVCSHSKDAEGLEIGYDQAYAFVIATTSPLKEALEDLDSGLAKAMRFAIFDLKPEDLLEAYVEDVKASGGINMADARQFCDLADSLDANGVMLQRLRTLVGKNA